MLKKALGAVIEPFLTRHAQGRDQVDRPGVVRIERLLHQGSPRGLHRDRAERLSGRISNVSSWTAAMSSGFTILGFWVLIRHGRHRSRNRANRNPVERTTCQPRSPIDRWKPIVRLLASVSEKRTSSNRPEGDVRLVGLGRIFVRWTCDCAAEDGYPLNRSPTGCCASELRASACPRHAAHYASRT